MRDIYARMPIAPRLPSYRGRVGQELIRQCRMMPVGLYGIRTYTEAFWNIIAWYNLYVYLEVYT